MSFLAWSEEIRRYREVFLPAVHGIMTLRVFLCLTVFITCYILGGAYIFILLEAKPADENVSATNDGTNISSTQFFQDFLGKVLLLLLFLFVIVVFFVRLFVVVVVVFWLLFFFGFFGFFLGCDSCLTALVPVCCLDCFSSRSSSSFATVASYFRVVVHIKDFFNAVNLIVCTWTSC